MIVAQRWDVETKADEGRKVGHCEIDKMVVDYFKLRLEL